MILQNLPGEIRSNEENPPSRRTHSAKDWIGKGGDTEQEFRRTEVSNLQSQAMPGTFPQDSVLPPTSQSRSNSYQETSLSRPHPAPNQKDGDGGGNTDEDADEDPHHRSKLIKEDSGILEPKPK